MWPWKDRLASHTQRRARWASQGLSVTTDPTITAFGSTQHRVVLPAIGEQIDRYTVLAELGAGAMGAVFLAADTQLDRRIAVKVLTRGTQDNRLLDEARALAKLQHPNVVAIHDVGRWGERVYLAMEYIEGGSLAAWLESHDAWRDRLDAFVQAARGLGAAHRAGLVHHDVKPSNIMVGSDGRVRLVDFGLARSTPELAAGSPGGTPRYMSPEQRRGALADARTDQFSLCVALYEALFDAHPFAGASAEERAAAVLEDRVENPRSTSVPAHVVAAIVKGLACEPERRHATVDALVEALAAPTTSGRRIAWIAVTAAAAIATGVVVALVTSSGGPEAPPAPPADPRHAIIAASSLPDELHEPVPGDPLGVTIHRLSNGLTVYISPKHDLPRVWAVWRFRGGNADAPGVAGAAGVIATQQGTETTGTISYAAERPHLDQIRALYHERKAATGDALARIDRLIDLHSTLASMYEIPDEHERIAMGLGASRQSHDVGSREMQFTTELPSNRLGAWADLEADCWTHRVIRNFRARVRRLIESTNDAAANLEFRAEGAAHAAWFPGNPHVPSMHDIVAGLVPEPLERVEAFARDHFVPNNAELVLIGDVDPATAIPLLEKAFSAWEPRALAPSPPAPKPIAIASHIAVPTSGPRSVAFRWAIDLPLDDSPVVDVIELLLRRVRARQNPTAELHAGGFVYMRDFGVMELPAPTTTLADAGRAIELVVDAVRHGEFSDDDLDAVKRNIRFNALYNATDNESRIAAIAKFQIGQVSWRHRVELDNRVATVTRADVMRVADRMFAEPHLTISQERGTIDVERVTAGPEPKALFPPRRTSAAGQALVARERAPLEPKFLLPGRDYDGRQTPGGYLIVAPQPKSDLFQLTVKWEVGFQEIPHLCDAVQARWLSRAVVELGFRYALRIQPRCMTLGNQIEIVGADDQLPHAFEMVSLMMSDPTADDWAHMKPSMGHSIADHRGDKAWVEAAAGLIGRHGIAAPGLTLLDAHPLAISTVGDGVRALRTLRATDRAIAYVGRRSLDDVAALVPAKAAGAGAKPLPVVPLVKLPRVMLVDAKGFGTTVGANVQVVLDGSDRRALLDLLQQYWLPGTHPMKLSGTAEVGFSVPEARREGRSIVDLKIETSAANVAPAIESAIAELMYAPADPTLVARAKLEIDDRTRADWLTMGDLGSFLLLWHAFGIDGDPRQASFAKRERLGPADLDRLSALMRRSPRLVTVWGDLTGVDRVRLRRLGPLTEMTFDELIRQVAARKRR